MRGDTNTYRARKPQERFLALVRGGVDGCARFKVFCSARLPNLNFDPLRISRKCLFLGGFLVGLLRSGDEGGRERYIRGLAGGGEACKAGIRPLPFQGADKGEGRNQSYSHQITEGGVGTVGGCGEEECGNSKWKWLETDLVPFKSQALVLPPKNTISAMAPPQHTE